MLTKEAYLCGRALALQQVGLGKVAGIDVVRKPGAFNFWNKLLGDNVNQTAFNHLTDIISHPSLGKLEDKYRNESMRSIHTYVDNVLRGKVAPPKLEELPETRSLKARKQILSMLRKGQQDVASQMSSTRRTRLSAAGAVAAPVIGGVALTKSSAEDDSRRSILPGVAGGAAAAAPILQGLQSGALRGSEPPKNLVTDMDVLKKKIEAGDILLTGEPNVYRAKAMVIAGGGDPHGYHVQTAVGSPKGKARDMKFIHSAPGAGGAYLDTEPLTGEKDIIVRRFKDPSHRKAFIENMRRAQLRDQLLGETFGDQARASMYDASHGLKIGLKDLLPKFLRERFASGCPSGSTVCSTLPGLMSPVPLAPGIPGNELLPHHIQKSDVLETIGHYYAPRTAGTARAEAALRTVPWLGRGVLGAGLGYGAYKGVKALMDRGEG